MLGLTFSESPQDEPGPPGTESARFALVLKISLAVVAAGLVGGFLLLSGGEVQDAHQSPAPPVLSTSSGGGDDGAGRPERDDAATTTKPELIAPPVVKTDATEIERQPRTTKPKPTATTPRDTEPSPRDGFVRIGKSCDSAGSYGLTRKYQLAVCRQNARSGNLTWQRAF